MYLFFNYECIFIDLIFLNEKVVRVFFFRLEFFVMKYGGVKL